MDLDVYINGALRTDLRVLRITQSYVAPWTCELAYAGRHDRYPCDQYAWVVVRRSDTNAAIFRGNIVQVSPGGVADEGIVYIAQGRRFRLENEPVNINGSGFYIWNRRGHQCDRQSGEDSPDRDGGLWTAGQIIIDIVEHALGIPAAGSDIPGHHSSPGCVTDTYLTAADILGYNAADWLALDSVIGEYAVNNTPVAVAIQDLIMLNGGFYGWYIDGDGILRLYDLKALPETNIEAGELGHWQDEIGKDYRLLDNKLDWSLDGVYSSVMVQGTDRTVEVKPANLDGCANAAMNGGGELELINTPWKGYACAYRALDQPYRKPVGRSVGFEGSCEDWRSICECGVPAGMGGIVHLPRVYRGTDAGAKTYVTPPAGGFNWYWNYSTGIVMFFWDVSSVLAPGEKLWGWYWAKRPFTVTAGPEGTAYECLDYKRMHKISDPAFKHPTSWPHPGTADDETAMGILADRMLDHFKDIRIQGRVGCDDVDPDAFTLTRRYNVTRLQGPTTTTPGGPVTTAACWPHPLDWGRLGLNAIELTHDFEMGRTEITLANTFFMLEGYSELRRRMELNLFAERELNLSEDILDCQVVPPGGSPDDEPTVTEWPTTSSTAAPATTTTTPGGCNGCDPPLADQYHVTLCGMGGDFAPWNGDHTLNYTSYCLWYVGHAGANVTLEYDTNRWIVTLVRTLGTSCRKRWEKSDVGGCTPTGAYTELDCLDDTCADHASCADSAGATCDVSLSGGACPTTTTPWCDDCEDLSDLCYRIDFRGCCDEADYSHKRAYVEWIGAGDMVEGKKCLWRGMGMEMHLEVTTTTTQCPFGVEIGWGFVELVFDPVIGWYVTYDGYVSSTWLKDVRRHEACDPLGAYTCAEGGSGTAEVFSWPCPTTTTPGPSTTTGAPPTTTPPPPTTTTTAAPPTTTTTAAPPSCADCGDAASCNSPVTVVTSGLGSFCTGQPCAADNTSAGHGYIGTCIWQSGAYAYSRIGQIFCSDEDGGLWSVWQLMASDAVTVCARARVAWSGICPENGAYTWHSGACSSGSVTVSGFVND